jgi:putative Mg2+ transporter-C (MgtC) family protein
MNMVLEELTAGLTRPGQLICVLIRLLVAMLLAGLIGYERLHEHKQAGLRTHMLVALGAALFSLIPSLSGMDIHDASRVIQGVAAGVGFLGAGTILKLSDQHRIEGLTSAASIWVTAAVGTAAGVGFTGAAIVAAVFSWVVLALLQRLERRLQTDARNSVP